MACQAHLGEVQARWPDFAATHAVVLGVAPSPLEVLRAYLTTTSWSFEIVCDPERIAYRRLSLARARWRDYLRPKVLFGYLKILFHGGRVKRPSGQEDLHQLGGDFLFDRSLRLRQAWRSRDPIDRPSMDELLNALQRVADNNG
jgi:hypothetical protein